MDYHMRDEIEEDALNQKYCIEVLRRLISKADTDIEELEGELLLFETQLEWAKQNKAADIFELCCKKLGEGINLLELSICNLKRKNNHDDGRDTAQESQMATEPVTKVYEIIKSLLDNSFQDSNDQLADMEVVDDGSDCLEHSVSQSNHNQKLCKIGSSPTETEEVKEASANPMGADRRVDLSSEPEKMVHNQPEKMILEGASVTDMDRLEASLILKIKKEICPRLDPVDNVQQRLSADVATFLSSLRLESRRTTDTPQSDKHEAGDAVITKQDSLRPSLGLKEERKKIKKDANQAKGYEPKKTSVKVEKSKSCLKLQNQQTEDNVQQTGVTSTSSRPRSSSVWEGKKKRKIAQSEQVDVQKPLATATDKANSPKPPLKFQRQIAGNKACSAKPQVQEVDLTNDSVSDSQMSSLMLQTPAGEVTTQSSSAFDEIVPSKLTIKMPRPKKKDKIPSHRLSSEEIRDAVTTGLDSILKGQKLEGASQSPQAAKSCPRRIYTSKLTRKLERQGLKEMILSNNIKAQEPLGADTGVAITLVSLIDLTQEVPEMGKHIVQSNPVVSDNVDLPSDNDIKSKNGKRKRQIEVDILNSAVTTNNTSGGSTSTSKKKRRRMIVMSSSDEEPSAAPGYKRFNLESIFKSWDSGLSMQSRDAAVSDKACDKPRKLCHKDYSKFKYHPEPFNVATVGSPDYDFSQALVGPQEFRTWTAPQLRSLAKSRGLKGIYKLRKEELVQLLTEVKDD